MLEETAKRICEAEELEAEEKHLYKYDLPEELPCFVMCVSL